jgi:hypothetical protein
MLFTSFFVKNKETDPGDSPKKALCARDDPPRAISLINLILFRILPVNYPSG